MSADKSSATTASRGNSPLAKAPRRGRALREASARGRALATGIVSMNKDQVPRDFRAGFDSHILDVRLTDATEDGGLFGLRFE